MNGPQVSGPQRDRVSGAKATQLAPLSGEGLRRAARLVVCAHARDAADAAQLLDALGLLPADSMDPGGRR
jgi:hypothetical protein